MVPWIESWKRGKAQVTKLVKLVNKLVGIITQLLMMHNFKAVRMPLKQEFEILNFQRPKIKQKLKRRYWPNMEAKAPLCCIPWWNPVPPLGSIQGLRLTPRAVMASTHVLTILAFSILLVFDMKPFIFLSYKLSYVFKFLGVYTVKVSKVVQPTNLLGGGFQQWSVMVNLTIYNRR